MKRIILLSIMIAVGFTNSPSWAQERPSNPGEDPNLAMTNNGAHVAAAGTGCVECDKRLKAGRIYDDTAARKDRDASPTAAEDQKKGTK